MNFKVFNIPKVMKQIIGDARMRILIWLKYHFLSAIPHWLKKIVHSPAAQGAYTAFKQKKTKPYTCGNIKS